jgi:hypothetical protein
MTFSSKTSSYTLSDYSLDYTRLVVYYADLKLAFYMKDACHDLLYHKQKWLTDHFVKHLGSTELAAPVVRYVLDLDIQNKGEHWSPPKSVDKPIVGLGRYDLLMCTFEPGECQYAGSKQSVEKHLRSKHRWSPHDSKLGRPAAGSRPGEMPAVRVQCHKFGKSYTVIKDPGEQEEQSPSKRPWAPHPPLTSGTGAAGNDAPYGIPFFDDIEDFGSLLRAGKTALAATIRRMDDQIFDDPEAARDSWLARTKWPGLFEGIPHQVLIEHVREPPAVPASVAVAVWDGMNELFVAAHDYAATRACTAARQIAYQVERASIPSKPLPLYQGVERLSQYCRPWCQILMFFCRHPPGSGGPTHTAPYVTLKEQEDAWREVTNAAALAAADPGHAPRIDGGSGGDPGQLSPVAAAVLDFCVLLLEQTPTGTNGDYECALTYAAALLGVKPGGFHGADSYPHILSALIKGARLMFLFNGFLTA